MILLKSFIVFLCLLNASSYASLIQDFIASATNFWPRKNDVSAEKDQSKLPKMNFELPLESEEFIKEGLMLIDAPREALDVCTHRVIHNLKKNCNQLNLEEIGKLSVLMLNCQLEIEGRPTFSCKPEMTLQQCTMGMEPDSHQAYNYMTHRAVGICSALKQDQYRALAEITVNRLMQAAQFQVSAMNEALKTQRRLNDMGNYNFKELSDNDLKMKEKQVESLEKLQHAENLIEENLVSLQQELLLRQKAEEKLSGINKSTEDVSKKLEQHTQELHEGHEKLLEDVNEISKMVQKNNQDMLEHYEETLAFLENIKSVMEIFSHIGTSIKTLFKSGIEIFPELGLKVSEEFVSVGLLNLVYFVCGMIYMLFINAGSYTKRVLLTLVAFNSVAAAFKTKTPLFAVNFFVWFAICAFNLLSAVTKRLSTVKFNIKMPALRRPTIRGSPDSDNSSEDELQRLSTWPRNVPATHQVKIENSSVPKLFQSASAPVKSKPPSSKNSDDDDFSLMNVCRPATPISPQIFNVPESPLASRALTPTFRRILRDSISEAPAVRPGTPFNNSMLGRVQCKSLTAKGLQCRNASNVGFTKCRVHNNN